MKTLLDIEKEFNQIKKQLANSENKILSVKLINKLEKTILKKSKNTFSVKSYYQHQEITIQQTARQIYQSQKSSRQPILLIGAGASIESGGPSGFRLMEEVILENIPAHSVWKQAFKNSSLPKISNQKIDEIKNSTQLLHGYPF